MLKKLVLFVAAVMLLASSAHALVNDVAVKSTAPTIVRGQCEGAGSLSLTFDQGTVVSDAQTIEAVLQGGKFCKAVDLYVNATAVAITDDDNGPLQGNYTVAGGDFVMHVHADKDSSKLTMKVLTAGTLTADVGGAQLVLFNGQRAAPAEPFELLIGTEFTAGGKLEGASNYTAAENSLCVVSDLPDFQNLTLSLGPKDSKYKFGDVGANPPIAVVVGDSPISLVPAKGDAFMKLPGKQASCSFKYEDDPCGDAPALVSKRYFALKNGADYLIGDYEVEMEILVNGASGDNGVYFEAATGGFQFTDAMADLKGNFVPSKASANHRYFLGNAAKAKPPVIGCERKDDQKVTRIISDVNDIDNTVNGKDFLRVGIPAVAVTKAAAGDEIALKITVRQGRCTTLYSGTYKLFKMVAKCPSDAGEDTGSKLVFPYFADAPYWNGMALTNTGSAPVNATLAIVDAKGGEGTINVMVPAKGMYVDLVENIIANSAFNGTVNAKERCYIIVTPESGNLKGFAMMGNTKNAGESMGYTVNND